MKTEKQHTEKATNSKSFKNWDYYLPFFEKQIKDAGLDDAFKLLPEMLAKEFTGQVQDNKGFAVFGGVGCGKTRRILLFRKLFNVKFVNAFEVCNVLQRHIRGSESYLDVINANVDIGAIKQPREYDLIVDDIGYEDPEYVVFGDRRDIGSDIIQYRYNLFAYKGGHKTHFTTNLTDKQLYNRYGEANHSRLKEMCHFVTMPGEDRRKK